MLSKLNNLNRLKQMAHWVRGATHPIGKTFSEIAAA
jgi:hypothetical protein